LTADRTDAFVGNRLRSEYEAVLTREELRRKYPLLQDPEVVEAQLGRIDALATRVPNAPERVFFPRDPKDAMTINLAIERSADFIVTRDNDLLYLNDDPTFQRLCPHTRIVSPVEFLQAVAEWKGS
jgi:putative PIN family toxin of toxin-antitoxin system